MYHILSFSKMIIVAIHYFFECEFSGGALQNSTFAGTLFLIFLFEVERLPFFFLVNKLRDFVLLSCFYCFLVKYPTNPPKL